MDEEIGMGLCQKTWRGEVTKGRQGVWLRRDGPVDKVLVKQA